MQEELVTFKTAVLASDKSFNWETQHVYSTEEENTDDPMVYNYGSSLIGDEELYAPTQSLLHRWLREVHDIRVLIDFETIDDSETAYTFKIVKYLPEGKGRKKDTWGFYETTYSFTQGGGWYKTYEEALELGLIEGLKLIKNDKDK